METERVAVLLEKTPSGEGRMLMLIELGRETETEELRSRVAVEPCSSAETCSGR